MMTIRPRHAYAVALLLAFVGAASARPGVPRQAAQPPTQAAPALPAQDAAAGVPIPRQREVPAATTEQTNVAAAAFLDVADTGDVEHTFLAWTSHPLPPLCDARFASGAAVTLGGQMMARYHPRRTEGYIPDDVLYQTIAVYRPGGAARFMRELRDAVAACPVNTPKVVHCNPYREDARYRLLRAPGHGDEAILGRITFAEMSNDGPTGRTATQWFLAVRIGDAVTVLANTGYEYGHMSADAFREVGAKAVPRFTGWVRR
jgi:hypothetical protein